nr:MAG TPA: hypothetical protein [Caudoviricetes sp.]
MLLLKNLEEVAPTKPFPDMKPERSKWEYRRCLMWRRLWRYLLINWCQIGFKYIWKRRKSQEENYWQLLEA